MRQLNGGSYTHFDSDELFYDKNDLLYGGYNMLDSSDIIFPTNFTRSRKQHIKLHPASVGELVYDIGWNTTPTYSKLMWYLNKNRHLSDPALASMSPEDLNATLLEMIRAINYVSPIELEIINGLEPKLIDQESQWNHSKRRRQTMLNDWGYIGYDIDETIDLDWQDRQRMGWDGETDQNGQPKYQEAQLDVYKLSNSPRLTAFFEKNPAVQ